MIKKKIAIVSQRYGLDVNGGAETLARVWAERLNASYHVEVLTTCAVEYSTWANDYFPGMDYVNGIPVRRFPVDHERQTERQHTLEPLVFQRKGANADPLDEAEFFLAQGPANSGILRYIEKHSSDYDIFIFVTYLYFTTMLALPLIAEKAVLIPAAHDEAPFYMDSVRTLMHVPRFIFYNTIEERDFVHATCRNQYIPHAVVGMGIDVLPEAGLPNFAEATGIRNPYILYVGRIDEAKGCRELFSMWNTFKAMNRDITHLDLVLLGKSFIPVPVRDDIHELGFVSEDMKYSAMKSARLLVMPSSQESLSIVVLESMLYRTPVLVNGCSEVLKGHIDRGHGGLYYTDENGFYAGLRKMLTDEEFRTNAGNNGFLYAKQNYDWCILMNIIQTELDRLFAFSDQFGMV